MYNAAYQIKLKKKKIEKKQYWNTMSRQRVNAAATIFEKTNYQKIK